MQQRVSFVLANDTGSLLYVNENPATLVPPGYISTNVFSLENKPIHVIQRFLNVFITYIHLRLMCMKSISQVTNYNIYNNNKILPNFVSLIYLNKGNCTA